MMSISGRMWSSTATGLAAGRGMPGTVISRSSHRPTTSCRLDACRKWRAASRSLSLERVRPAQSREPRKVRIGGAQISLVLDRERRQVRIGGEVPGCPEPLEEIEENRGVALARMDDGDVGLSEPRPGMGAGLRNRKGMCQDLTVRAEPQKAEDDHPWQPHRTPAVHDSFPPTPGAFVHR